MGLLWRHQLCLQLGNGICAVLGIAWIVIVGRRLIAAEANEFYMALALATVGGVACGAFRSALGRVCALHRDDPRTIAVLVAHAEHTLRIRGAAAAVAAAVVMGLIGPRLGMSAATGIMVAAAVLTKVLLDAPRAGLGALGKYPALAGNGVVEAVARIALGLPMLLVTPSATTGIAAYVAASVVARAAIRGFASASAPMSVTSATPWPALSTLLMWNAVVAIAQHVDTIVVAARAPAEQAAAFGAAAALLRGFALLALPVQLHLSPHLTAAFARGQLDHRTAGRLVGVYLVGCAVPLCVCLSAPRAVLELVYGPDVASQGAHVLAPLAIGAVLVHLGITMAGILVALGRFAFLARHGVAVLVHTMIVAIAAGHSTVAAAHAVWIGQALIVMVVARELAALRRATGDRAGTAP